MSGFTAVFGGTTIAPANATYLALEMAADVDLAWPIEQAINGQVVADTIDVNATVAGLNINLPDARQVSTGYTALFNNVGANTVTVRTATGGNIISLVSGTAWVIYLTDNSTEGGSWRVFQLGASVSVAVAGALAGAGLRAISTTLNQDIPVTNSTTTPFVLVSADDRAKLFNWTGGLGAWTLPDAVAAGNGWYVQIRNSGSGDLTLTPPAGTIDGAASKTFAAGTSAFIVTDGTDYFTLGYGSGTSGGSSFDFIEINVAGSGTFTLSGANLNRISYRFIGVLTGTRNIVVPNSIQQYWVANATTGAFSLFIKTVAQVPGVEVLQNNQAILYCDSTDVIDADSSTVSFPIPVVQGGTGAITAANARTNLGATATGDAVFTAANAGAARTAIGATATGSAVLTAVDAAAGRTALGATATGSSVFTAADAAAAAAAIAAVPTSRTVNTSGTGLSGGGDLTANRTITIDQTAMTTRNITGRSGIVKTLSTAAPSGGADGDIWYRYVP